MKLLAVLTMFSFYSCNQLTNKEVVIKFNEAAMKGSLDEYSSYLDEDVVCIFKDINDSIYKKDIVSNHSFYQPYGPWNSITSLIQPNDSTVEIQVLEYDKLQAIFELDTIAYLYRYNISNSLIMRIEMEGILELQNEYQIIDSIYNKNLSELIDWIALHYPKEYDQLSSMDSNSSKTILELAMTWKEENAR
ncbi:MAG: hypothetical protein ABJF04_06855 [Reichenbachiella sp.]|uniref:hypothetical protein n=1 Tax=Reichenbachiella sp. TaxID=2184521 RepID=UPI003265C6DA